MVLPPRNTQPHRRKLLQLRSRRIRPHNCRIWPQSVIVLSPGIWLTESVIMGCAGDHFPPTWLKNVGLDRCSMRSAEHTLGMLSTVRTDTRMALHPPGLPLSVALACLFNRTVLSLLLTSTPAYAQRYVRVSAEIEFVSTTWKEAGNTTRTTSASLTNHWTNSVALTIGTNRWQMEGNFSRNSRERWLFDGTNVINTAR